MVLVEDVTNNPESSSNQPSSSTQSNSNSGTSENTTNRITLNQFIINDKISFLLWCTRLFTIISSFLFIFPFSSFDQSTLYQKALLSSAATSALKLHQRLNGVRFSFSRDYFQRLIIEDSCHYLLFSLLFLNSYPITIVLVPILLFAILHVASYTKALLTVILPNGGLTVIRKAVFSITAKDKDIMRFAAINEILLMPAVIFTVFSGKGGIFLPFIYYRFICLRYQSRRNPYNRTMFTELRLTIEFYVNQPRCPSIIRNTTQKLIAFICRIAPQ